MSVILLILFNFYGYDLKILPGAASEKSKKKTLLISQKSPEYIL